jgi:hypothetical protein
MVEGVTSAEAGEITTIEELRKPLGRLIEGLEAGTAPKTHHGGGGGGCGGNELATVER